MRPAMLEQEHEVPKQGLKDPEEPKRTGVEGTENWTVVNTTLMMVRKSDADEGQHKRC